MIKNDKTAIVTGASRGIGFAIACELADMGYSLGIVSGNETDIRNAAEKIRDVNNNIKVITGGFDITDSNAVRDFVNQIIIESGDINVLINNAGIYIPGTSTSDKNDLMRMMDINFYAATSFVNAVLPSMKKLEKGYIINISSLCGIEGFADTGSYSSTKFALVGYSASLMQELAPLGIKVTALCPSWVNSGAKVTEDINPDDMIQLEDIKNTIRYLLNLGKNSQIREIIIRC